MDKNRIKKIAEEYADSFGDELSYRNDPCYPGHVHEAEDVLEWLNEDYIVVNRNELQRIINFIDYFENEYYNTASLGKCINKLKELIKDL